MIKEIQHESVRLDNTFDTLHKFQVKFDVAFGKTKYATMAIATGVPADSFAKALREWADKIDAEYDDAYGPLLAAEASDTVLLKSILWELTHIREQIAAERLNRMVVKHEGGQGGLR